MEHPGAVARQGAKAAAKVKPKKARKPPPESAVPSRELAVLDAWRDYTRATRRLLAATGTVSIGSAELRVRVIQSELDRRVRQRRRGGDGPTKPPKETRSASVRTVSGGSPGLGKRR